MTSTAPVRFPDGSERVEPRTMPWFALALLATMGFLLVAAETMPAGLLPVIADGMDTSEGVVGQFISVWALGTVIVTIPAISLTRGFRRKPLLLASIACLIVANTVTALSSDVAVSLVSRFVAGAFTGIIWGMLAAYGRRISPPRRAGLALSIVSVGAPVGFALGTPLGAWLGMALDWRWSFGGLSLLALLAFVLIALFVPDAPGQPRAAAGSLPLARVFAMPGVAIVCLTILVWMLAHNTIYTYIAPFLREGGSGLRPDLVLLVYGVSSILGVAITAAAIDRFPRALLHSSLAVFVLAGLILLVGRGAPAAVLMASVLWGIGFGGASAQLQSALSRSGRENSDIANSFLPVAFNLAIFAAGIIGALLLENLPALVLAALMAVLGALALIITLYGRRTAFTVDHLDAR
ncbi:putative MFS family arabinose efflux permease [Rathayibacter sp. PhB93]|uniref:MFS transporter n=1 Tax=unclassified Rathayibacter TaxID=2609250 RepID=UPI000FB48DE1|nr:MULTISPECIES: MFS transporter [unclassified Rathayibacter]ROQ05647.1 putative MFS family arabinose efflux permease [Rathayibacter sp. PhB93]TDQ12283.1 putative MFS family arabinose efflux permease [Rathayibacter sp. PhB1]